jgi:hypothetical protein
MTAAFGVIWGQSSESVQAKLKSMTDFQTISNDCNMLGLLTAIESLMFLVKFEQNMTVALVEVDRRLKSMQQDASWSAQEYLSSSKLWFVWSNTLVVLLMP